MVTNPVKRSRGLSNSRKKRNNVQTKNVPVAYVSEKKNTYSGNRKFTANGATTIRYREYIDTFNQAASDYHWSSTIQPAVTTSLFTWLPSVAGSFENYRFRSLSFQWIPTCSVTTAGSVSLAWDPNAMDEEPVDLNEVLTLQYKSTGPIYSPINLRIDPSTMNVGQDLYIRSKTLSSGDLRLTDLGRFTIWIPAGAPINSIGQLYVSYEIDLWHPQTSVPDFLKYNGLGPNSTGNLPTINSVSGDKGLLEVVSYLVDTSNNQLNLKFPKKGRYHIDVNQDTNSGSGAYNLQYLSGSSWLTRSNQTSVTSGSTGKTSHYSADVLVSAANALMNLYTTGPNGLGDLTNIMVTALE